MEAILEIGKDEKIIKLESRLEEIENNMLKKSLELDKPKTVKIIKSSSLCSTKEENIKKITDPQRIEILEQRLIDLEMRIKKKIINKSNSEKYLDLGFGVKKKSRMKKTPKESNKLKK